MKKIKLKKKSKDSVSTKNRIGSSKSRPTEKQS